LPAPGGRTLIMGVMNVTPDSFSDGGRYDTVEAAVARAKQLVADGADILDMGAESTRPGAPAVSEAAELARLIPVIRAVRAALPDTPLSVDTYKAGVAEAAIAAGADIINDVHGGRQGAYLKEMDSPMCKVAAATGAPIILMHNREKPDYRDFRSDFLRELHESLAMAMHSGVSARQIWVDPGFGFGKTPEHNLEVTRMLPEIVALGYPVLFGASNKSTLGKILGRENPSDRHEGNVAAHLWAAQAGAAMIRVHEPAKILAYLKVTDAIRGVV
jgi:dihydropteroate synthase